MILRNRAQNGICAFCWRGRKIHTAFIRLLPSFSKSALVFCVAGQQNRNSQCVPAVAAQDFKIRTPFPHLLVRVSRFATVILEEA